MVKILSNPVLYESFTSLYLKLREKEGWQYSDAALALLPFVSPADPNARIWQWRARSIFRLVGYLKKNSATRLRILDVGCGNGWMAHLLARTLRAEVWGIDINLPELETADRVFQCPGLQFVFAAPDDTGLPEHYFDVVILAGSIQYFADLPELKRRLQRVLRPGGAVHIIDSNFYSDERARTQAQSATADYYTQKGVSEMAPFYHHHLFSCIGGANLNDTFWVRFLQKTRYYAPFPWILLQY